MGQPTSGDTVRVHYTGTLAEGETFDSSQGREPFEFTLGASQVIPGFEKAVEGMQVGETRTATIPAAEAYGEARSEMRFEVEREKLPEDLEPEVGQRLTLQQPDGNSLPIRVVEVADQSVTLDANHPLAGEDLTFELELVEIVAKD